MTEFLRQVIGGLFANGPVGFGVGLVGAIALLLRMYRSRKRLSYEEIYNSKEGIRAVRDAPAEDRSRLLALSDGPAIEPGDQLQGRPVAVLIYALVVNRQAGVAQLSAEQVRQINTGQVVNWADLGGADLPVRVVGRDSDSGSRSAFEAYVLGGAEAPVSSNSCLRADRVATATVVRCERSTTDEVLTEVDTVPGAIGYADASATAEYRNVQRLSSDAAARRLREGGYVPCVRSDRSIESLCSMPR